MIKLSLRQSTSTLFTTDSKRECKEGDIIFCVRGNTTGRMNWADTKYSLGRGVCSIRGKTQMDTRYLRYCIEFSLEEMLLRAGGSTMPNLTQTTIRHFLVPYPTHRGRIAAILSAYDDLIENNLRRIKILEEMAQLIYREWFVNFRFPGHEKVKFVNSKLGKIPEDWIETDFGHVSQNFDRLRKPLSKLVRAKRPGPYPYYGAARVFDYIDDYIFDGDYLLVAEDGSVITPDRKPVLQLTDGKFWANNHTHIIQGRMPVTTEYLYLFMSDLDISPYVTGAAQPKINQQNLNRIPLLQPSDDVLRRFDMVISPIFAETKVLKRITKNLRQTRDLLLPRLVSGEVDVEDLDIRIPEEEEVPIAEAL